MPMLRLLTGVAGGGLLAAAAAAAAAAFPAAAPVVVDCRIAVKPAAASADAAALERRVAAVAGVAARYVAAIGPAWHALALRCDDAAQCDAAVDRLRAAPHEFEAVDHDRRRRAAPA